MLISGLMKGMDLPINMIVIVAIAVLVLVVVVGFFGGFFTRGLGDIEFNKAFDGACNQLRTIYNCDSIQVGRSTVAYQAPGKSTTETWTLAALCTKKFGGDPQPLLTTVTGIADGDKKCAQSCGCPV